MSHTTQGRTQRRYFIRGRIHGFTLIELMITIAVIAILVALAVPAYRGYTIRAKIGECIHAAAVPKLHISEYRQSLGAWPPSAEVAAISLPAGESHFCTGFSNYQPGSGTFTVNIDSAEVDAMLGTVAPIMVPEEQPSNMINWDCRAGGTDADSVKYLPSSCRDAT
jgi:type IV pilus assembly protein PilA